MSRTELDSKQILDGEVMREDLNVSTNGQAVIRKVTVIDEGFLLTSDGADDGTGDVVIRCDDQGFGSWFESIESLSNSSTTSNGWVTKATHTTTTKVSGIYLVLFNAMVANDEKEKMVGSRFQYRIGSGSWNNINDDRNAQSKEDNRYSSRGGFHVIVLSSDDTLGFRHQYGQTDDGGSGKMKEAKVVVFKASPL